MSPYYCNISLYITLCVLISIYISLSIPFVFCPKTLQTLNPEPQPLSPSPKTRPGLAIDDTTFQKCSGGIPSPSATSFPFLPRPSYVVPFWVVYYNPLPKNYDEPKKELHRSPWVVIVARRTCSSMILRSVKYHPV